MQVLAAALGNNHAHGAFGQWHGVRQFRITGQPPMVRVARYAADSRRCYEPTPQATDDHIVGMVSDVSDNLFTGGFGRKRTAAWSRLRPRGHGSRTRGHPAARRQEGRHTVQPLTLDVAGDESVTNLFGASVQLEGVVATFASADVGLSRSLLTRRLKRLDAPPRPTGRGRRYMEVGTWWSGGE